MVLHILLTVLKIIGIAVLVLLGVILAVLLAVLFVPIRYRISARWQGTDVADLYVRAELSWLLRLVGLQVLFERGQVKKDILFFGATPARIKSFLKGGRKERLEEEESAGDKDDPHQRDSDQKKDDRDREEAAAPEEGQPHIGQARGQDNGDGAAAVEGKDTRPDLSLTGDESGGEQSIEEKLTEEKSTEKKATEEKTTEEKTTEEKTTKEKSTKEKSTEKKSAEEKAIEEKTADERTDGNAPELSGPKRSIAERISSFWKAFFSLTWRIPQFFLGILARVLKVLLRILELVLNAIGFPIYAERLKKKLADRAESLLARIRPWKEWLRSEVFSAAFRHVWRELVRLLAHIRPRRLTGWVRVGFDDPSLTGELMGALGMIYPVLPRNLSITPVFDGAMTEFDVQTAGRLYGIAAMLLVVRLLLDKNVRGTISTRPRSSADAA